MYSNIKQKAVHSHVLPNYLEYVGVHMKVPEFPPPQHVFVRNRARRAKEIKLKGATLPHTKDRLFRLAASQAADMLYVIIGVPSPV